MMRDVIEVNRYGLLLDELKTFDADLHILNLLVFFSILISISMITD